MIWDDMFSPDVKHTFVCEPWPVIHGHVISALCLSYVLQASFVLCFDWACFLPRQCEANVPHPASLFASQLTLEGVWKRWRHFNIFQPINGFKQFKRLSRLSQSRASQRKIRKNLNILGGGPFFLLGSACPEKCFATSQSWPLHIDGAQFSSDWAEQNDIDFN